jgi:death-on-curing protein
VEILIDRSGCRLNIPDDEPVDDLVVAVAAGEIGFTELVSWFKGRLARR